MKKQRIITIFSVIAAMTLMNACGNTKEVIVPETVVEVEDTVDSPNIQNPNNEKIKYIFEEEKTIDDARHVYNTGYHKDGKTATDIEKDEAGFLMNAFNNGQIDWRIDYDETTDKDYEKYKAVDNAIYILKNKHKENGAEATVEELNKAQQFLDSCQ